MADPTQPNLKPTAKPLPGQYNSDDLYTWRTPDAALNAIKDLKNGDTAAAEAGGKAHTLLTDLSNAGKGLFNTATSVGTDVLHTAWNHALRPAANYVFNTNIAPDQEVMPYQLEKPIQLPGAAKPADATVTAASAAGPTLGGYPSWFAPLKLPQTSAPAAPKQYTAAPQQGSSVMYGRKMGVNDYAPGTTKTSGRIFDETGDVTAKYAGGGTQQVASSPSPAAPAPTVAATKPTTVQTPSEPVNRQLTDTQIRNFRDSTGTNFNPSSKYDRLNMDRMLNGQDTLNAAQARSFYASNSGYNPGVYAKSGGKLAPAAAPKTLANNNLSAKPPVADAGASTSAQMDVFARNYPGMGDANSNIRKAFDAQKFPDAVAASQWLNQYQNLDRQSNPVAPTPKLMADAGMAQPKGNLGKWADSQSPMGWNPNTSLSGGELPVAIDQQPPADTSNPRYSDFLSAAKAANPGNGYNFPTSTLQPPIETLSPQQLQYLSQSNAELAKNFAEYQRSHSEPESYTIPNKRVFNTPFTNPGIQVPDVGTPGIPEAAYRNPSPVPSPQEVMDSATAPRPTTYRAPNAVAPDLSFNGYSTPESVIVGGGAQANPDALWTNRDAGYDTGRRARPMPSNELTRQLYDISENYRPGQYTR